MEYTQLDKQTQLTIVRNRIRDLEQQHATLNARIEAPAPGEIVSEDDKNNLAELETSLKTLHDLESTLAA